MWFDLIVFLPPILDPYPLSFACVAESSRFQEPRCLGTIQAIVGIPFLNQDGIAATSPILFQLDYLA